MADETNKKKALSREDVAKVEVGHTDIPRGAARVLVAMFLLTVAAVPVTQVIHETRAHLAGERDTPWPQVTDFARLDIPASLERLKDPAPTWLHRVFNANARALAGINRFEDDLEDQALLGEWILSPTQQVLSGRLGVGNEQAYLGRGQWLFYRPGVDYLTGPGFLDPRQLAKRAGAETEWQDAPQPDPRGAILDFHRQLAARGVTLIVVPTPVKPMIHPEHFSTRYGPEAPVIQSPSYAQFLRDLAAAGVLVFDPSEAIRQAKLATGRPQYLATDTHWRPEAMELTARKLKEFIERAAPLPAGPPRRYKRETLKIENLGDIAVMLKLPADQELYRKEKATVQQVLLPGGELWRADRAADVLLLGDSFTNVYSVEAMGWGDSGGLAEQLSFHLRRGVDRISRNDNGSVATRRMLARELAKGRDRLAGKKLVIWQFAIRELAVGDWPIVPMTLGEPTPSRFLAPEQGATMTVTGTIQDISPVPKPGSVPYKDHIAAVHLVDLRTEKGPIPGGESVVYLWSMRDNKWTRAARYRPGKTVTLRLRSWYDVADKLDAIKRSELADEDLRLEDPCWGEETDP